MTCCGAPYGSSSAQQPASFLHGTQKPVALSKKTASKNPTIVRHRRSEEYVGSACWGSNTISVQIAGPRDEGATFIVLRTVDDHKPLVAIWHYTCHPNAVVPIDIISADYPGAVRVMLRQRFGEIPCVFAQGFCGNIRPNVTPAPRKSSLRERLARFVGIVASGNLFPDVSAADWIAWSRSLANAADDIVKRDPAATAISPETLEIGAASIPIDRFFSGSVPDKLLSSRIIEIGDELEIVVLSAEPTVEWTGILDDAVPRAPKRLRLYAAYLGEVFGYLPTSAQVLEGGYEVEGFQPLFGLSGRFESTRIEPAVVSCVKSAFDDMEREANCPCV